VCVAPRAPAWAKIQPSAECLSRPAGGRGNQPRPAATDSVKRGELPAAARCRFSSRWQPHTGGREEAGPLWGRWLKCASPKGPSAIQAFGGSAVDEIRSERGRRTPLAAPWAHTCVREALAKSGNASTQTELLRRVQSRFAKHQSSVTSVGHENRCGAGQICAIQCAATVYTLSPRAMWRDYARLGAIAAIWLVLVGSYWTNPAPASLAGLALPKDVGRWLNRGALCREVAGRCAKGNNCGDGVTERCGRAASAAVLRASGRCRAALAAIEPADGAAPVVARARDCLRHAYRYAFRREGLPVPRLASDV